MFRQDYCNNLLTIFLSYFIILSLWLFLKNSDDTQDQTYILINIKCIFILAMHSKLGWDFSKISVSALASTDHRQECKGGQKTGPQ